MHIFMALFAVAASGAASVGTARAGTVVVETSVATEVRLEHQPLVKTFGAAQVDLPGLAAGKHVFVVFRDGKGVPIEVVVPEEGRVRLLIGEETLTTDATPSTVAIDAEGTDPPRVEFRAAEGEQFSLILDGERTAVFSSAQPLILDSLGSGDHVLEIRSSDQTVVWVRGTLELRLGDELIISVSEGRMVEVFGRSGSFLPGQ